MHNAARILTIAGFLSFFGNCYALDFDFSGTFTKDNDIAKFVFYVDSDSPIDVTIFSSSWISNNKGFDPILTLWKSDGFWMGDQDDADISGSIYSNGTLYEYGDLDINYSFTVTKGYYIATITQYDNKPIASSDPYSNFYDGNLEDGFVYDDVDNFTFTEGYGPQSYFNGTYGYPTDQGYNDPRTGFYSVHFVNVDSVTHEAIVVPDGGCTLGLLGLGLCGVWLLKKERMSLIQLR
jgi:hypothetical protein